MLLAIAVEPEIYMGLLSVVTFLFGLLFRKKVRKPDEPQFN